MNTRHQPGSLLFGLAIGIVVAMLSYRWLTAPDLRTDRLIEESVVADGRRIVATRLRLASPEIVDPLAPRRSVGKVYVYPVTGGWEVSGYYRRDAADSWHAYLMHLDPGRRLVHLRVHDHAPEVAELARRDPMLEVLD